MPKLKDIGEIHPEVLNTLFEEGAFFIFLDVPTGTEFGIDMKIWNTDENFRGVKMIPPGLHFIHYSSVDNYGEIGTRSGFFHDFKLREVFVKKWDKQLQDVSAEISTADDIEKYKQNLKNLDKYLGCYPYDIYEKWKSLSNFLYGIYMYYMV